MLDRVHHWLMVGTIIIGMRSDRWALQVGVCVVMAVMGYILREQKGGNDG